MSEYDYSVKAAGRETQSLTNQFQGDSAQFRYDLGLKQLLREWRTLFTTKHLKWDLIAGANVAFIAIPLSLAIALASDVNPGLGLISAIIGSFICALFGGNPLSVSGPTAAISILVGATVEQFGLTSLLVIGTGCGILQILTGIFRLGPLIRFIPVPVISGFTAGVGTIIFIDQLPRALGLPAPDQSHVLSVLLHIHSLLAHVNPVALVLATSTFAITFILPRFFPKAPAAMIAVIVPSVSAALLGFTSATIGEFPALMALPKLGSFPVSDLSQLIRPTIMVFALATLESLLLSTSIDRISNKKTHDLDQELIGQGLGNFFSSLFGGIPVSTGGARSIFSIASGAKTRRAAIFHSISILTIVVFFGRYLTQIPIAVLTGILFSVSLKMLQPREFLHLWRTSRAEASIFLLTFVTMVFLDLVVGVQAGITAALIITAIRAGRAQTKIYSFDKKGPAVISFNGDLTFLSTSKMESVKEDLNKLDLTNGVVIDMSRVRSLDVSGGTAMIEIMANLQARDTKFAVQGLSIDCQKILFSLEIGKDITDHIVLSEAEVKKALDRGEAPAGLSRLLYGVQRFHQEVHGHYQALFNVLEEQQKPHSLFITCCDSRVNPNLITTTDPGELFIVRTIGNIIPPAGNDPTPAEGAAIEYALGVLDVTEIIVCAHSGCGAMNAVLKDVKSNSAYGNELSKELPNVSAWLKQVESLKKTIPHNATLRRISELNTLLQLDHLKTYPLIQKRLAEGKIRLHAWYYDIKSGQVEEWDETQKIFKSIK